MAENLDRAIATLRAQNIEVSHGAVGPNGAVFQVGEFMLTGSQILKLFELDQLNLAGIRAFADSIKDTSNPSRVIPQLGIKDAVKLALTHVEELYQGQGIQSVLLEEIGREGNYWYITISFYVPGGPTALKDMFSGISALRAYKIVEINATTGELAGLRAK